MGILDDLSSAFSKAQAGATRFADSASLKFKLGEADRKRRDYMAQLGESLYGMVCVDPALKAGREEILAGIAQCEADKAQAQAELDRIAKEAAEAKAATLVCPNCGGALVQGAMFCPTCGAQVMFPQQPKATDPAPQQPTYTQAQPQAAAPQQPAAAPEPQQPAAPQQPAQPQQPGAASQPAQAAPAQPQSYEVPEN